MREASRVKKNLPVKNFYSNFFYGKSRTEEILCKTKDSKFNEKICDYKMLRVLLIAFLPGSDCSWFAAGFLRLRIA
jgi:hypothetical protein